MSETGEFKYGSMLDSKEAYKISTFGRIFSISRQALVNDDLGGFSDLSARLGAAAAVFEAQSLVDLITSNNGAGPVMDDTLTMFHASHKNVPTGGGGAPSTVTLSAARLAMRRQTSPGGGLLDVTPMAVVVPPELETSTEQLLTQIQATQIENVNVFARLRLIVEPRLVDAFRWYVVSDPNTIDGGLEFAFLAGLPGPQVESRAGFGVDGIEVKVRLDFGAGVTDHRSWFMNSGR